MCCAFALLFMLGPRFFGIIWWIARPGLWNTAFTTWIWPVLGLVFLPWTTLMWMFIFPGGVTGFEWFLVAMAVVADIATYGGSAYGNRDKLPI